MILWNKTALLLGALLSAPIGAAGPAFSQSAVDPASFPNRPVRMVVGFAPGGGTDTIARIVSEKLSDIWGRSVVVDNKPGAGGQIAAGSVAKATPDGYTILADSASFTINPALYPSLPYDSLKDFEPISLVGSSPYVLVVNPEVPANSVKELIDLAKAKPGQLNYASAGVGSSLHLAGELFKSMANVDIVHVPYQGANGILDLLSGRVQLAFAGLPQALPHIRSGRLRALAVTTSSRSALLQDVPTVTEAGVPGYEVVSWYGTFSPAGTPKPIVDKISAGIGQALQRQDVRDRFLAQGLEPVGTTPDAFAAHVRSEIQKWREVVRTAKITTE